MKRVGFSEETEVIGDSVQPWPEKPPRRGSFPSRNPPDNQVAKENSLQNACIICFDEVCLKILPDKEESDIKQAKLLKPCLHVICFDCLKQSIRHHVTDRRVPIVCPGDFCVENVSVATIERLLEFDEALSQCYHELVELKDGKLVKCTNCDGLVDCTSGNDLHCSKCSHSFCKIHGDMHLDGTCEEFLASPRGKDLRRRERSLARSTKPCTSCGALLQKVDGCNHVICGYCKVDLCWRCGTHEFMERSRCKRCEKWDQIYAVALVILFSITLFIWPPLALASFLSTGFFCGCFMCGHCIPRSDPTQAANCGDACRSTTAYIFAPFFLIFDEMFFEDHFPEFDKILELFQTSATPSEDNPTIQNVPREPPPPIDEMEQAIIIQTNSKDLTIEETETE